MLKKIFALFFLIVSSKGISQEKSKQFLKPYKIGFLYNFESNENFAFDDVDYTFDSKAYKGQFFYKLGVWKSINFELLVEPQVRFLNHQLINEQFITPDQENYLEKRAEFTTPKKLNLYGFAIGILGQEKIFKNVFLQGSISLGIATINKRTERLAKGFTFIDDSSLGILFLNSPKHQFFIGGKLGHVSNFNLKKPNSGFNTLGFEISYSFVLN